MKDLCLPCHVDRMEDILVRWKVCRYDVKDMCLTRHIGSIKGKKAKVDGRSEDKRKIVRDWSLPDANVFSSLCSGSDAAPFCGRVIFLSFNVFQELVRTAVIRDRVPCHSEATRLARYLNYVAAWLKPDEARSCPRQRYPLKLA